MPELVGDFVERLGGELARVVEQDVKLAKPFDRCGDEAVGEGRFGDVARHEGRRAARRLDLADDTRTVRFVAPRNHDRRRARRVGLGRALADTRGAARDQGDLAGERILREKMSHFHRLPLAGAEPTIDRHHRAGHEGSAVGCEEEHALGQLLDRADTPKRGVSRRARPGVPPAPCPSEA